MKNPRKIEVYTDGSAKGNGTKKAVGGWAYIVLENGEQVHGDCGYQYRTSNQKMELYAAIEACRYLADRYTTFDSFTIYSDSAYLINCANNKWYNKWYENNWKNSKGDPVANKFYWRALVPFFEDYHYTFKKVKGHSNVKYNNIVDKLAQAAAEVGRKKHESNNN